MKLEIEILDEFVEDVAVQLGFKLTIQELQQQSDGSNIYVDVPNPESKEKFIHIKVAENLLSGLEQKVRRRVEDNAKVTIEAEIAQILKEGSIKPSDGKLSAESEEIKK